MVTFHELADLFRSLGIDLSDLSLLLAKKAGAKGAEKLAGASKAAILNFLKRVQSSHEHDKLESVLKRSSDVAERELAIRTSLERWINEHQHEALETTKLLFRIVYLRALRDHCNDLPVVANLGFLPQTLNDVWIQQDFRIGKGLEAAGGLGRVGLCEAGQRVLAELDLKDENVVASAIAALVSCKREEQAIKLCRDYLLRADVDFLDRVEVAASIGRLYRKDLARSLILETLGREKSGLPERSRAAEVLDELGYQSEARTILFSLQKEVFKSSILDFEDGLWLADAMISCGLYSSAKLVFDRIDRENVIEDSLDRYEEIRIMLNEPFLLD
jgi:hypothetical protein